ncbi:MAG: CTP-dependent riboflavin kinase [Nanoarchaeota archaeon]|nr:CTP-dependent riboflavin kinase [Nanoarchaeota archaeon]
MGDTALEGIVVVGLGTGAVFMSIDHYKAEFKDKLGFDPYPGTLNMVLNNRQTNLLKDINPIRIESFKKDNKTFGGVSCYKVKINNVDGAIIVPDLTEHEEDTIEIIAPINLKLKLNIKDGDKIKIELIP